MAWDLPPALWLPSKPALIRAVNLNVPPALCSFLPGMFPGGVLGNKPNVLVVPVANAVSTTNGTSYSFTSQNFGDAAPDRLLVVVVSNKRELSEADFTHAVTIGGVAATQVSAANASAASTNRIETNTFYALVPTGASGTVAVTTSASVQNCSLDLFALYNVKNTTPVIATAAASITSDFAALTVSLSGLPSGSGVVAGAARSSNAGGFTWSGLTAYTGRDIDFGVGNDFIHAASAYGNNLSGSVTITATVITNADGRKVANSAAWR